MTPPEDFFTTSYLKREKQRHERGEKEVILRCLSWCFSNDVPPPAWLRQAFCAAQRKGRAYEIKTWDDAFGRVAPKGKQISAMAERLKVRKSIYDLAQQMHTSDPKKHPLDRGLFETVAVKLKLKPKRKTKGKRSHDVDVGRRAEDYYYEHKAIVDLLDLRRTEKPLATLSDVAALHEGLKPHLEKAADAFKFKATKKNPRKF